MLSGIKTDVKIEKSHFANLTAERGAALTINNINRANLINCSFDGNMAEKGGAIEIVDSNYVSLSNNSFFNN